MGSNAKREDWWELHVRKARGEQLTDGEQARYDAELQKHDQATNGRSEIADMESLRNHVERLSQENGVLRQRVEDLQKQIKLLEHSLSDETKELLGVRE